MMMPSEWNDHSDGQEAVFVGDQLHHVALNVSTSNSGRKSHDVNGKEKTNNSIKGASYSSIPNHIAFICDGNARWARQHHVPVAAGHAAGADRLVKLIDTLSEIDGVNYATFYAFSTENWKRTDSEIQQIFTLMEQTAQSMLKKSNRSSSVAVKIIGDTEDPRIPVSLRLALLKLEQATAVSSSSQNDRSYTDTQLTVSIAVNYSARNDMLQAVQAISKKGLEPQHITQDMIRKHLSTRDIPDPDLIVRTSGENRLSNWLLWEAAYAEFFVSQVHWPDFDDSALREALESYCVRQRRYGGRVATDT